MLRPAKQNAALRLAIWDEEALFNALSQQELSQQKAENLLEAVADYDLPGVSFVDVEPTAHWVPVGNEQGALVLIQRRLGGKVIAVANGSFLLNLGLVNREHRKLASMVLEQLGPPPRRVYFLQGGTQVPIFYKLSGPPTHFTQLLAHEPLNHVLGHLLFVAVLAVGLFWPIFGRPLQPPNEQATDFGQHIEALGHLLAAGNTDRQWARERGEHYLQLRRQGPAAVSPRVRKPKKSRWWSTA